MQTVVNSLIFTFTILSKSSSEVLSALPTWAIPALFTNILIDPMPVNDLSPADDWTHHKHEHRLFLLLLLFRIMPLPR